jgi:hypothetical protein
MSDYLPVWVRPVALLLAILCSPRAEGQTTAPAPTSLPTASYSDPAFGFELQLPAGWEYDRTRFQDFKDSIGLLRGRGLGGRRGLQVVVFRSFPMKPFEDWVVDFGRAVVELTGAPRVRWETWQLPPRAGAVLTYGSKLGAVTTRSHYLCVPFDPNTVWVLTYSGTASSPAEEQQVRREFDQVAASLRVHYDPEEAERLAPALDRGKALRQKLLVEAAKVRPDETEYAYDIVLAGKSVGYLTRRITREEYVFSGTGAKRRYAKDGLRVRERGWDFADDGTARYTRLDLFSSFDLEDERIENQQTQIPPPEAERQELLIQTDQVIREDDVLFSSYTTSLDTSLPDPSKPISVGPVYLDQAWVRLLPGLLLAGSDEPLAVAIYNFGTRALLSHTVKPLGQRKLAGYVGPAYAFEIREGFVDRPNLIYSDERGNLLRLEAGDLTMTRVSREEVERKYGPRRDAACRRFGLRPD